MKYIVTVRCSTIRQTTRGTVKTDGVQCYQIFRGKCSTYNNRTRNLILNSRCASMSICMSSSSV